MKNTSQGYPRNYTANTTGDILQVAEKIYWVSPKTLWVCYVNKRK